MRHFEELQKPCNSDNTVKNSAEDYTIPLNNNNNSNENKNYKINTGSCNSSNECEKSKINNKKHQKLIESVDNEIKIQKKCSDSSKSNKKSKRSLENDDSEQITTNKDSTELSKKMDAKAKRKLRQRILEKLLHEQKSEDDEKSKCSKKKKTKVNKKSDDRVEKINENTSQENETIQCKQKKTIVSVRRRRFRSGLDMIRHPHRRKKPRVNHMQGSKARNNSTTGQECANHSGCDLKANEDASHKSNSESGNASLPTEMKRLMVNKALGETLLHRAARSNRKDVVKFCLQSNTCDVNARDNANYTPLHECSTRGNLEIARALLQNSAEVDASAVGGIRPLHDAIENNHIEVVRLLLAYGADPNISTYSGATPLKLARSKAMVQFLKGFLSDISVDNQKVDSKEKVLSWKFNSSSNFLDTNETGFDIFDGLPSDADEEESDDFLFEVSDTPLDPTYRYKSSNFLRLSDVLRRTCLTKDEFVKKHSNIEVVSIPRHDLDNATISQLLTTSRVEQYGPSDCYTVDMVHLDDNIRNILDIETVRLR